eukprot:398743-Pyramimonas_sp.AAC.1
MAMLKRAAWSADDLAAAAPQKAACALLLLPGLAVARAPAVALGAASGRWASRRQLSSWSLCAVTHTRCVTTNGAMIRSARM